MATGNLQQDERGPAGPGAERPLTRGVTAIAGELLLRRFRSRRFVVLLAVYGVVVLALAGLASAVAWALATLSNGGDIGPLIYSSVVFVVLLLAIVAGPAVQGRALNAPALIGRTTGGTSHRSGEAQASAVGRVLGALLAEWVTSLTFVAVALPVLLVAAVAGGVAGSVVIVSLLILTAEILVLGAIAVGLSGLITRPARSVAAAYAAVAALTLGTLLVFALVGNLVRHEVVTESRGVSWSSSDLVADCGDALADGASDCVEDSDGAGVTTCEAWQRMTSERPRLDLAWWVLTPNPFVLVADATPATWLGSMQSPADLFGMVTAGVRQAQVAGATTETLDACTIDGQDRASTVPALVERTASSWYLGLVVQAAIATGLLIGAVALRKRGAERPVRAE